MKNPFSPKFSKRQLNARQTRDIDRTYILAKTIQDTLLLVSSLGRADGNTVCLRINLYETNVKRTVKQEADKSTDR